VTGDWRQALVECMSVSYTYKRKQVRVRVMGFKKRNLGDVATTTNSIR
jgi:hypothetical protein